MEIVLVRHAQPDWEPEGVANDEPGLTAHGHQQAQCCADALAGERFDAFYASPLRRVAETAAPIAKCLGMEPLRRPWLREIRLPPLSGKTTEEVRHFFETARSRDPAQWWDGLPGGESFRHFHERVSGGIEGLLAGEHRLQLHEDGGQRLWRLPDERERILIVAHEGTNAVLLSHLLGIDAVPWEWLRFSSAWAGITRLHTTHFPSGAVWVMERFNDTHHLVPLEGRLDRDGRGAAE